MSAPEKDIFNTKWVIAGVIIAALLIPLLSGCGVKGDLKHPKTTTLNKL
jgi:predicted small lipoprotein YifL